MRLMPCFIVLLASMTMADPFESERKAPFLLLIFPVVDGFLIECGCCCCWSDSLLDNFGGTPDDACRAAKLLITALTACNASSVAFDVPWEARSRVRYYSTE